VRILIATDSFPPRCGGSGWSTYELSRGLRARGHEVLVVRPVPGAPAGIRETNYDGLVVQEVGFTAPDLPYVRNYFKSEWLTRILREHLSRLIAAQRFDIVHAQHVMTALPSIHAARQANVPVVITVRDYWPVCYWSDLIRTPEGRALCPECSVQNMTVCIRPRAGVLWPAALTMIPYMRANLATKREGLSRATAVIAVSRQMAADLSARAPELRNTRIDVIPNPVDVAGLRAMAGAPPLESPYALYLGKLAPNKGTRTLLDIVDRSRLDWPLVIGGDGPDRADLERRALGRAVRFLGWLDRADAVRWLAHASMLIFPSRGPESLSRVLIEASALGVPIAAMDTGGTRDIIEHDRTGLLSNTPEALADDVRRLREDPALRARLAAAARDRAEREFEAQSVVTRIDRLYAELLAKQ
jgi:glycogen(starch) synthase